MLPGTDLCGMKNERKILPLAELDGMAEDMLPQLPGSSNFFFCLLITATLLLSVLSVILLY